MDKHDKVYEYQARGMKLNYYHGCRPFRANVEAGYIVRAPEGWLSEGGMYGKAKWQVHIVKTRVRRRWFFFKHREIRDYNYMPILYCLFCGKEL